MFDHFKRCNWSTDLVNKNDGEGGEQIEREHEGDARTRHHDVSKGLFSFRLPSDLIRHSKNGQSFFVFSSQISFLVQINTRCKFILKFFFQFAFHVEPLAHLLLRQVVVNLGDYARAHRRLARSHRESIAHLDHHWHAEDKIHHAVLAGQDAVLGVFIHCRRHAVKRSRKDHVLAKVLQRAARTSFLNNIYDSISIINLKLVNGCDISNLS